MREGAARGGLPVRFREVPVADLTPGGRKCREYLRGALDKRFVEDRYLSTGDCTKPSYLFDAAALAHPALVKMRWVDSMSDNGEHAKKVKGLIKGVILTMLADLHVAGGGRGGLKAAAEDAGDDDDHVL